MLIYGTDTLSVVNASPFLFTDSESEAIAYFARHPELLFSLHPRRFLISKERQLGPLGEVPEAYSVPISPRRTVQRCLRSRLRAAPVAFDLGG